LEGGLPSTQPCGLWFRGEKEFTGVISGGSMKGPLILAVCFISVAEGFRAHLHVGPPNVAISLKPLLRTADQPKCSALPAAIVGGTLAGGLHAVTGPDHLAALLPLCMGRRWWVASSTGALWGIGHGLGAALIGALGFALRGALNLDVVSSYMEIAVGFSIIIIGATGFKEAREWRESVQSCAVDTGADADRDPRCLPVMCDDELGCEEPPPPAVVKTLLNGILNGISGTGHVLGVLPALAMPNWAVALAYLSSFGIGTFLAMAVFTGLVGEISFTMGSTIGSPEAPANLAMAASIVALTMGSLWSGRALAVLGVPAMVLRRLSALRHVLFAV